MGSPEVQTTSKTLCSYHDRNQCHIFIPFQGRVLITACLDYAYKFTHKKKIMPTIQSLGRVETQKKSNDNKTTQTTK